MSFQLRFKGLNRVRLSDVSKKIIPEMRGPIGKGLTAS